MKKLLSKLFPAFVLASLFAVACTEEKTEPVNPVFPEAVTKHIEPESTVVIDFTANLDWKLSIPSETAYFRIEDGSQEVFTVKGPKGDASVTVKCIAKEQDFENHTVELELEMGGKKQVIATVILASKERTMNVTVADVRDGAFVPAEGENPALDWSYTGKPLAENGNVNMLWDLNAQAYKAYIRVESNYEWKFSQTHEDVEIASGKVSGLFKEYTFTVKTPNLAEDRTIPFALASSADPAVTNTFNLVVPKHNPEFAVYKAKVKDGFFELPVEESPFTYEYEKTQLTENSNIELVWPNDRVGFSYFILVDANFAFEVEAPKWLTVKEGVREGSRMECEIVPSELSLEAKTAELKFKMAGADYSKTFKVTLPACKDILKEDLPELIELNAEGRMKDMNGEFSMLSKYYSVTSPGEPVFFKFVKDGEWFKSESLLQMTGKPGLDWITFELLGGGSEDILKTFELKVEGQPNSGDEREAIIVGLPASVAETISDPDGQLLDDSGCDVRPEYKKYLAVKFTQQSGAAAGEPIVALDQDLWPMQMAEFRILTPDDTWEYDEVFDAFSCGHNYKLTYGGDVSAYPTVGEYLYLKFNKRYTDYRVYNYQDKMTPVADKENFWVKVTPAPWAEEEVSISMTPGQAPDQDVIEAFIVFTDENGEDYAAIYCAYDPNYNFGGGDSAVAPEFAYPEYAEMEGSVLEEITPEHPLFADWNPGDGSALWHLKYTTENTTISMLKGLPQGMAMPMADWISVEQNGEETTIVMDKSAVPEDAWNQGRVTSSIVFYDSNWSTALTLVCTLDLSGAE